jgi:hypothetical protein
MNRAVRFAFLVHPFPIATFTVLFASNIFIFQRIAHNYKFSHLVHSCDALRRMLSYNHHSVAKLMRCFQAYVQLTDTHTEVCT